MRSIGRRLFAGIMMALSGYFCVSAQFAPQNARINGLGGTFIFDDMSDIMRYAVLMKSYKDDIQATFGGPVMGIKGVGDVLSLGAIVNRGLILDNSFYQRGSEALTGGLAAAQFPALQTQHIPHLLLGIDLSAISLGFDLFYEYASASLHNEPQGGPVQEGSVRIHNPGGIVSISTGLEEIPIEAKIGFGIPSIGGRYDNGSSETTVKSKTGIMIEAGGEVGLPIMGGDIRSTLGVDMIFEGYSFSVNDADPVTKYSNNRMAFYGGLEGDLFTSAKWGAMYDLIIRNNRSKGTVDTVNNRQLLQTISGGIENGWTTVWIFDEVFARTGLALNISTPVEYRKNATSNTRRRQQTTYTTVGPTVGLGVKKGVFQLDITLNPAAWGGVVAGPEVGTVSATFMF